MSFLPPPARPLSRRSLLLVPPAGILAACAAPDRKPAPADEAELEPLFADLGDQSARWQPIRAAEKRPRLARAARALTAAGADALLVEPGPTLSWFSDVEWGRSERLFALVVLADGSCFWLCPAFEAPRAEGLIAAGGPAGPIVTWDEHEYAFEPLAAALAVRRVEQLQVAPDARAFVLERVARAHGAQRTALGLELLRELRGKKDARELELMRGACELTLRAIQAVAERLPEGLTDHQLGRWITHAQERLGLTDVWCLPLIGPGAAAPHGGPEGRRLEPGVGVLVDTGGGLHGYQSDLTRSWHFGPSADPEFLRAWSAVRSAQESAFARLAPGVPCREIDRAARAAISAAGYPGGYEVFGHRLGHGIGLEGHEEPYLDGGNALPLEPGMTFSDEPGIYLPGRLGVRLEDIVAVTASGGKALSQWQESPTRP